MFDCGTLKRRREDLPTSGYYCSVDRRDATVRECCCLELVYMQTYLENVLSEIQAYVKCVVLFDNYRQNLLIAEIG